MFPDISSIKHQQYTVWYSLTSVSYIPHQAIVTPELNNRKNMCEKHQKCFEKSHQDYPSFRKVRPLRKGQRLGIILDEE